MAAQAIGVYTIDFPDPYAIDYDNNKFNTLNSSVGFQYRIWTIQTLSTKGADTGSDPYGILYVPDLRSENCTAAEHDYVPTNATRLHNLPPGKNYALIAVLPWYDAQCTLEYMAAARKAPTKALFVFQPNQGNAKPPMLKDASWNLNDGGAWQGANRFPTYALTSTTGVILMDQLAKYSGNMSDVPHGHDLAQTFNSSDYIRLWATVNVDSGTQLPSLWVFLVIVMAILLVAVSTTSVAMHIVQRRRRRSLRQRVLDGQVDLEALGVKRLTVPKPILDKLPIYTYTAPPDPPPNNAEEKSAPSSSVDPKTGNKTSPPIPPSSVSTDPASGMSTSWSQPTCVICLDDFKPNETQVRELPCHHVFHPDCIDTFLLRNSSLCPVCKQSVLPKGECPVNITNMMVRRERHITRLRARSQSGSSPAQASGVFGSIVNRIGAVFGRRTLHTPASTRQRPPDIEMAGTSTSPQPSTTLPAEPPPAHVPPPPDTQATPLDCEPPQNRREWARQRALAMLGNRHTPASDAPPLEEQEPASRWRRMLNKVFPGFR